jgi:nucleotide-binding universal stress UspA family protein
VVALDSKDGNPSVPVNEKVDYEYADSVQTVLAESLRRSLVSRNVKHEVHFATHVRIGVAAAQILQVAAEISADLILVGSHGHAGVTRLLVGSVSERVVREAKCPVMVVREKSYLPAQLYEMETVQDHAKHYVAPHRYSYRAGQELTRRNDWPLW